MESFIDMTEEDYNFLETRVKGYFASIIARALGRRHQPVPDWLIDQVEYIGPDWAYICYVLINELKLWLLRKSSILLLTLN